MKIPRSLKRFINDDALFISAGKQDAALYRVANGAVELSDKFKIPTPHYSDNEGSYGVPGRGSVTGSGGTRERRDDGIIREFIREFKIRIKSAIRGAKKVYVFAPAQSKKKLCEALPVEYKNKVAAVIEGNHFSTPELNLLRLADEYEAGRDERAIPNPEARKILSLGVKK